MFVVVCYVAVCCNHCLFFLGFKDCGVFASMAALCLRHRVPFHFDVNDTNAFRMHMLASIKHEALIGVRIQMPQLEQVDFLDEVWCGVWFCFY